MTDARPSQPASAPDERTMMLEPGAPDDPRSPSHEAPTPEAGTTLGRYVVLERVGAGAMGVVLRAYDPRLQREVALKLLRHRHGHEPSADAEARMVREAQAMAQLSHPNVLPVYDVDSTAQGLCIAMEFVQGQTLADWAEGRAWREVVAAYVDAGRGLAAAHAVGLVHRDFKPHNVMIGDDGRVRVMDFGLARGLGSQEREAGQVATTKLSGRLSDALTQAGSVMGTPIYMAPEQMRGEPATERSDQYAFCVALFVALHGTRPFDGDDLASLYAAKHGPPAVPSGSAVPPWVLRVLLRGIRPEPGERFADMGELLRALQRDPARTWRRWLAVGLMLVLLGGGGAYLQQREHDRARVCMGAADRLDGIWDDAQRQRIHGAFAHSGRVNAEEIWNRTTSVLDAWANDWVQAHTDTCEATHVRQEQSAEALDLRMTCLGRRLDELEALTEVLAEAGPEVVDKAIEAAVALPSLEGCADLERLRSTVAPPEDPAVAERVDALHRRLSRARALKTAGRYHDGMVLAQELDAQAQALGYGPLLAQTQYWRGRLEELAADYEGAERNLERAYATAVEHGVDQTAASAAIQLVFVVGVRRARHEDAEAWARDARAWTKRLQDPANEAYLHANLGTLADDRGQPEQARRNFERSLALWEDIHGPDHPETAVGHHNLAQALLSLGRYAEAREHMQRSYEIWRTTLGQDHPQVADTLNNLASVAQLEGALDEARGHYERAIEIYEQSVGPEHPLTAAARNNLGSLLITMGEHQQAYALGREALAVMERTVGPEHRDIAVLVSNLAEAAFALGKVEEARGHHLRAIRIREASLRPDHRDLAASYNNYGGMLSTLGETQEAQRMLERALAIYERTLGSEHAEVGTVVVNLGEVALLDERHADALVAFDRALAIWEPSLGPSHPILAYALTGRGRALIGLSRADEAIAPLERALQLRQPGADGGGDVGELGTTRWALAQARYATGSDRAAALAAADVALAELARADDRFARVRASARAWRSSVASVGASP